MITERILQILDLKGVTRYKFSKDLGLSNGFLDKPREISTDKYAKILDYFPDISEKWLLTGMGEILKKTDKNAVIQPMIGNNNKDFNKNNSNNGVIGDGNHINSNYNELLEIIRKKDTYIKQIIKEAYQRDRNNNLEMIKLHDELISERRQNRELVAKLLKLKQ